MQIIAKQALLAVGLWGGMFLAVGSERISYPESRQNLDSPDKRYYIYVEENSMEPFHSAFIFSRTSGESLRIVDFNRHIDVAWSPDSSMFYVNDYVGSDFSTCKIYGPNGKQYADIVSFLRGEYEKYFSEYDHVYGVCKRWGNKGVFAELSLHGNYSGGEFSKNVFVRKRAILLWFKNN